MEKGGGETVIGGVVPATSRRYSLSFWEVMAASVVVLGFVVSLGCVYLTMPQSDYSFLKLPRNLQRPSDSQVARRKDGLLNYMLFLRLTPTMPNTFINVASPIVDVPYHIFFLVTFIGLIPAAFVTVRAGIALGELQSLGDLYDLSSMATLFLIGVLSVTPTLISKKKA